MLIHSPLGKTHAELEDDAQHFANRHNLMDYIDELKKGAVIAQEVVLCSVAAAVQGMDESVVNGAQLFFPQQFGIATSTAVQPGLTQTEINKNEWLLGLVTGAPYVSFFFFSFSLNRGLDWAGSPRERGITTRSLLHSARLTGHGAEKVAFFDTSPSIESFARITVLILTPGHDLYSYAAPSWDAGLQPL